MKKLLIFMLVLGLASLANAGVVDVATVGVGDQGHAGTSADPLVPSETIGIQIILNYNPYTGYPSYDGYATDGVGVDLHVSGPGTLGVPGIFDKNEDRIGDDLQHHAAFDVWGQSGTSDGTPGGYSPLIVSNSIAKMVGGVLPGAVIAGDENGNPPSAPTVLIWNLWIHCDGPGDVVLDLTLQDPDSRYAPYTDITGNWPYPAWQPLLATDLGDLVIHNIPEPTTVALLGLGGMFLLRRRKS